MSRAVFVHHSAVLLGAVTLADAVSIWPMAVLRADSDVIRVGHGSNVQDGAVLHVDPGYPCTIGARVTIGHRAVVHGATVEDEALIGMGAIVLNGAVIGAGSIIGAGAVVPEGMQVPPNSLVLAVPARVIRVVTLAERRRSVEGAARYVARGAAYARGEVVEHGARG